MKITIQSTRRLVAINGVDARLWEGETDKGIPVTCLVAVVAAADSVVGADFSSFERDLVEHQEPAPESFLVFPYARIVR